MAELTVQQVIRRNALAVGNQILRHGGHIVLVQDVLCSLGRWASGTQARGVARALMGRSDGAEELDATKPESLTGDQLDAAFATLKLLSTRLAALSGMAHAPSSCSSSTPGLIIDTQSWLLPYKASSRLPHWQYGYEVRLTNTSDEPLQLLQKTWHLTELSGAQRSRDSMGLLGMEPVIGSGDSRAFQTAISLSSIKGSLRGQFLLKSLVTGTLCKADVPAFALTPTAQQYSDPHYMAPELLVPAGIAAAAGNFWPLETVQQQQQNATATAVPPTTDGTSMQAATAAAALSVK